MNPDIQKIREKYGITPIKTGSTGETPEQRMAFLTGGETTREKNDRIAVETRKNIGTSFKQRATNIIERVKTAARGISEYKNPYVAGIDPSLVDEKTMKAGSFANAIAQTGSAVAGGVGELGAGVGDLFINLFKGVAKQTGLDESQPVKDFKKMFATENLNPQIKSLLANIGEKAKENPEVAKAIEDSLNSFGLVVPQASKLVTQPVKEAITNGVETSARGIAPVVESTVGAVTNIAKQRAEKGAFDEALQVVKPQLTASEKELALKQGRVKTSGITRKTTVAPDAMEQRVADSVAPLVQDGRVSARALPESNIEAISQEVSRINSDVKNFIAGNKSPFNEKQLRAKLNAVKDENKLVFASEPTIENTFNAIVDEFVRNVKGKDTLGLFEARQSFDQIPAIKKLLQNEKLGENVRRQLVLDVRRAANDFVSDLLPANNPYKSLLKNESYLLRAIDNIAGSNAGRIDTNVIQRLLKQYPWLKVALGAGIGAGGVQFVSN